MHIKLPCAPLEPGRIIKGVTVRFFSCAMMGLPSLHPKMPVPNQTGHVTPQTLDTVYTKQSGFQNKVIFYILTKH